MFDVKVVLMTVIALTAVQSLQLYAFSEILDSKISKSEIRLEKKIDALSFQINQIVKQSPIAKTR